MRPKTGNLQSPPDPQGGVDVLLPDLAMPGRNGPVALLRQVLDKTPELRVIVFTAYDPVSHKERALARVRLAIWPKTPAPRRFLGGYSSGRCWGRCKARGQREGEPHSATLAASIRHLHSTGAWRIGN